MNPYVFQLRRVTWWTRKDPLEPVLTDDEELEDDEDPEPIDPNAPSESLPNYISVYFKFIGEKGIACGELLINMC